MLSFTPRTSRAGIVRRRLGYPLLTLVAALGISYFLQGRIATEAPAGPLAYERFARQVMAEVRAVRPMPAAVDPAVERVFAALAPDAVKRADGGSLAYEVVGPAQLDGTMPWIQSVVVTAPNGDAVGISISILAGKPEVVGVSRVATRALDGEDGREGPGPALAGDAAHDAGGAR